MIAQHFTERSRSVQYTVVDCYNDFANWFSYIYRVILQLLCRLSGPIRRIMLWKKVICGASRRFLCNTNTVSRLHVRAEKFNSSLHSLSSLLSQHFFRRCSSQSDQPVQAKTSHKLTFLASLLEGKFCLHWLVIIIGMFIRAIEKRVLLISNLLAGWFPFNAYTGLC